MLRKLLLLLLSTIIIGAQARLLVDWTTLAPSSAVARNFTSDYYSVPVKYPNNEYRFLNVSGTLISYDCGLACNYTDKVRRSLRPTQLELYH